jgi:ADP-heptose:LPS heptosyltransferase
MVELQVDRSVGIQRLDFPKYVLLAPFAAWEARDWPETHWRRLAWLLKEAGYEIVAIGTKKAAERMEQTFSKSYAYWAIDHDPDWVMDAMLDAAAVIGLDSGMIHVAGLLRVPTICIHSHLPPEFLFSHAPTVRSVTPTAACVFCRWQEDRGFMEGCGTACSALATVGPEAVMEQLRDMLSGAASHRENGNQHATDR